MQFNLSDKLPPRNVANTIMLISQKYFQCEKGYMLDVLVYLLNRKLLVMKLIAQTLTWNSYFYRL